MSDETVFEGPWRRIARRTFATAGETVAYDIKLEPDAAVVVALTPEREIVLVREFRPGTEEWLLELPGGEVDPGEFPADAAPRELLEEAGFCATLRSAGSLRDCAYSTRIRHVFVGTDAMPRADSAEGLEVVLMPLADFREHLRGGRLTDVGAGYRGLDALGELTERIEVRDAD